MPPTWMRFSGNTRRDALASCLEVVITWAGGNTDYQTIHAALGLPFWIAAPRREHCLGCWMTGGHDALLVDAGRLLGMRLRELHPPEAADGLEDSPEFVQHFEASYRPLIELALDNNQPVLVRRGWADECDNLWGVVMERRDGGYGLAGIAPGKAESPSPLTVPPVQVYVVEEIESRTVPPDELLAHVLSAARRVLTNQLDPRFGNVTGPPAYDAWLARLERPRLCPRCNHAGATCHARMAGRVRQARRSASTLLGRYEGALPTELAHHIEPIQCAWRSTVEALERSCDESLIEAALRNPRGRDALANDVRKVRACDQVAWDAMDGLAKEMGRAESRVRRSPGVG